jgi:hypothetical protein
VFVPVLRIKNTEVECLRVVLLGTLLGGDKNGV